jgi:hypothetical protein
MSSVLPRPLRVLLLGVILATLGTGCEASKSLLKAKPDGFTSFLASTRSLRIDSPGVAPFHYSARSISRSTLKQEQSCHTIWIAPVEMRYLRPTGTTLAKLQEEKGVHRPAPEMAAYLRQQFYRAFATNPQARYRVVDRPVKGSVELRLALTEFNQTNAAGNIAKTVVGRFVGPFAMLAGPFVKGTIAIEGKLVLHGSHDVLYQFADRESDPVTVFSMRSYNATGFAERSIDKWAEQFEKMTRMYQQSERVRDANVIRLNPF